MNFSTINKCKTINKLIKIITTVLTPTKAKVWNKKLKIQIQ